MLEKYKELIHEKLQEQCIVFCTIGSSVESPRWINIRDHIEEDGKYLLKFQSTQTTRIFFHIEVSKEDYESSQEPFIWDEFKKIRTKYLEDNFPTINIY